MPFVRNGGCGGMVSVLALGLFALTWYGVHLLLA